MKSIAPTFDDARQHPLLMSLRMLKYMATFMLVWQGSMVGGSAFEITDFILFGPIAPDEFYLIALVIITAMERTVLRDYTIRRSYFTGPALVIMLGLFISWTRGSYINQRYAVVYEAHEAILIPIALAVFINAFRDREDRWALLAILLMGPIFKALEGLDIYLFSSDPRKGWGVIQMWRDGYLLGVGVVAVMLFAHFRPTRLQRIRRVMFWSSPILAFTLIMSFRRTFIVGAIVSAFLLILTIGKERRGKQARVVGLALLLLTGVTIATDPVGVVSRMSGIIDPSGEGSAYIRLLELPNVLQNIAHNPLWGTAVGTQWKQYYRMPNSAVYTTLGTHNTYLYFPLRTGIIGTIGFFWLIGRIWKALILNFRFSKTEDEKFKAQLFLHMMVIYQVACFFGLMYGDAMSTLLGVILLLFQFEITELTGLRSYAFVNFIETYRRKELVFREPRVSEWIMQKLAWR